jgi:hypothetical protein
MGEEKKDEGAGDPIKMLLEEALEKQRNAMMDNFSQILQRIPTSSASTSNSHSGGATPFKVQVNFDIPIFEGQIDADVVDRWLNLLEGYFSVHEFSTEKGLFSHSSKPPPMSRTGGKPTRSNRERGNPLCSWPHPLGILSEMPSRNNIIPWGAMRTNTYNGLRCDKQRDQDVHEMTNLFHTLPQSWVSKIHRNIWC